MSNQEDDEGTWSSRLGDEENIPATPRQRDVQLLDDPENSIYDPITISVYPPSASNISPREDTRSSYTSSAPVSPLYSSFTERHAYQAHSGSMPDLFSASSYVIEQGKTPTDRSSPSHPTRDDPSATSSGVKTGSSRSALDTRSIYSTTGRLEGRQTIAVPPRWAEGPHEDFKTIDPFARKKHRLSWSSILSVKDARKRPESTPQQAWSSPIHYPTREEGPYLEEEEEEDEGTIPAEPTTPAGYYPPLDEDWPAEYTSTTRLRRHTHTRIRPHSFPANMPTSAPVSETDGRIPSRPESLHHSTASGSSRSSYHSFEEEKARKTVFQETVADSYGRSYSVVNDGNIQPTMRPVHRFGRQNTQTTIGSIIPPSVPSPEVQDTSLFSLIARYMPARAYVYALLGLPSIYFTRVATIFADANLSIKKLEVMILESASARQRPELHSLRDPAYERLTKSWIEFIDTLIREWKTINLISVLLLSAIVAILQIEAAFLQPVVHYSALFSLISALISLLFGCMYILRFNTMRMPHKAIQWAQETQRENTNPFWNVWILLAIPAVWLVWSLIFYIICIMAFVWRVDSGGPPPQFSSELTLAIRIGISVALAVGIIYGAVVVRTFINFGAPMDARFRKQVDSWIEQKSMAIVNQRNNSEYFARPASIRPVPRDTRVEWSSQPQFNPNLAPSNISIRSRTSRYSAHIPHQFPMGETYPSSPIDKPRVRFGEATKKLDTGLPNYQTPRSEPIGLHSAMKPVPTTLQEIHPAPVALPEPLPALALPPPTHPVPTRKLLIRPGAPKEPSSTPPTRPARQPQNQTPPIWMQSLDTVDEQLTPPNPISELLGDNITMSPTQNVLSLPVLIQPPSPEVPPPPQLALTTHDERYRPPIPRPRSSTTPILFNGQSPPPLSSFLDDAPLPISYRGLEYRSLLYLYQAMQYLDQYPMIADKIRTCEDPDSMREISRRYEQYRHLAWEDMYLDKLDEALMLKFEQHSGLGEMLLATGRRQIVYAEENDAFWGAGRDGSGKNELGKALMRVRDAMRAFDGSGQGFES